MLIQQKRHWALNYTRLTTLTHRYAGLQCYSVNKSVVHVCVHFCLNDWVWKDISVFLKKLLMNRHELMNNQNSVKKKYNNNNDIANYSYILITFFYLNS